MLRIRIWDCLGTIDKKSCLFGVKIIHAIGNQGFLTFDDVAMFSVMFLSTCLSLPLSVTTSTPAEISKDAFVYPYSIIEINTEIPYISRNFKLCLYFCPYISHHSCLPCHRAKFSEH